jgi:hypothetical protein
MLDFQERMAIGRANRKRAIERNGSSSVKIFTTSEEMYRGREDEADEWQFNCEDIGPDDPPVDWQGDWHGVGEEVDASPPEPQATRNRGETRAGGSLKHRTMTAVQYKAALKKLGLSPHLAAPHLGISSSMSFRYAAGSHAIPATVAKLIRALVKLGTTEV